jgi:hypothetical protein
VVLCCHRLFNWHPVLMVLAFAIFMSEAVLAYKLPWSATFSRYASARNISRYARDLVRVGECCWWQQQHSPTLLQVQMLCLHVHIKLVS